MIDKVFSSGYVVYSNQKIVDATDESKDKQAVPDTLEKEYEENIRIANEESRKQHGDEPMNNEDGTNGNKKTTEPVVLAKEKMNGREAFFSLMAIKMMKLSHKYQRKLEDLHSIFYMVSCDWQILE